MGDMQLGVERFDMGIIRHSSEVYGETHEGQPLTVWLPEVGNPKALRTKTVLGRQLAESTGLPLEPVKYAAPGFFGSWAQEHGMNLVTYEFEPASQYALKKRHASVLIDVLTGVIDPGES